jgi:hypothetical protein
MKEKAIPGVSLLVLAASILTGPARADDHIVSELKRTYMGRTYPAQISEVWMAGDKTFTRQGAVVVIVRHDLKKRWVILPARKKYLEEPLAASSREREKSKPARIQEYGFAYEPAYEWEVRETPETATFHGLLCRKLVARGVAEYAEEVREMWVAEEAPIDLKAYYERVVKSNLDGRWLKIYQSHERLRKGLVVKSLTTTEPAIAPASVIEMTVTKIEKAPPPDNTYELPEGLRKVATRDELFAR